METVDDRHLSVFAPSPAALEEVEEKISDILNSTEQVMVLLSSLLTNYCSVFCCSLGARSWCYLQCHNRRYTGKWAILGARRRRRNNCLSP